MFPVGDPKSKGSVYWCCEAVTRAAAAKEMLKVELSRSFFWCRVCCVFCISVSHRIHGTGIFTYIWLIFMVNVGKYTPYMDGMGYWFETDVQLNAGEKQITYNNHK